MSVLFPPRLVFQGATAWSPNTINNLAEAYDKERVVAPSRDTAWLKHLNADGTDVCGGWNLNGANDCACLDVRISRIQCGAASEGRLDDPLMAAAVQICGTPNRGDGGSRPAQIVDVDPKHPISAQIFFESFRVGDGCCGFEGPPAGRMAVRWPVLTRNLNRSGGLIRAGCAAVLWQAALPRATIQWHGLDRSPALAALKRTVESNPDHIGLSVRFTNYRTIYYQSAVWKGVRLTNPELLSAAYRDGFTGPNPAQSRTLGSIGIWKRGELASGPSDRLLLPGRSVDLCDAGDGRYISPEFAARAPSGDEAARHAPLGPAFAAVDDTRNVIALDFLMTFPERDLFLEKADFGSFRLQTRHGRRVTTIGRPITYDDYCRTSYEANAGVVEFAFDPALRGEVLRGGLELVPVQRPRRRALREEVLWADGDERGVYLDEGETHWVELRVFHSGEQSGRPVQLAFAQYDDDGRLLSGRRQVVRLTDARGALLRRGVVPAGRPGGVRIGLRSHRAGVCFVSFYPFVGNAPRVPARFSPQRLPYLAVRVLPFDNELERRTRDSDLSFRFIYNHILHVYDVVYPAMARDLDFDADRADAERLARIRFHLSPDRFESTDYLPVTRDLSAGKRKLLLRFIDQAAKRSPRGSTS